MSATADPGLHALAEAAGIAVRWRDWRGQDRCVPDVALHRLLEALQVPSRSAGDRAESLRRLQQDAHAPRPLMIALRNVPIALQRGARGLWRLELESGERREGRLCEGEPLPAVEHAGYHRLLLGDQDPVTLAVAPPRAFTPADLDDHRRRWGLTVQIPGVRRRGDAGLGDLGSVAQLARHVASQGGDALALSPVHAPFAAWPDRLAPYSPSSRLALNPLLADAGSVLGDALVRRLLAEDPEAAALEARPLIDPGATARVRLRLFRALFAALDASGQRVRFDAWCADADPALHAHALFEALHRHFAEDVHAPVPDWREWPSAFRDPQGAAVRQFATQHASEMAFGLFQQWLAAHSLRHAQQEARDAGMAIGLIADLAVGSDGAGSHAWSRPSDWLTGLRIGAPPDALNPKGQDWGLGTLSPVAMPRQGYAAFLELLRANLRHVGGLRLDHVFSLQRLWLIPEGVPADQGGYVHYPLTDLLRLIALESWRHRALVIGEDLGTIPDGFQPHLAGAGLMGMRVMWFQRDGGYFTDPSRWPRGVVAMTSTHDLPTVAGWWRGADLEWRARLDLLDDGQDLPQARAQRERDREALYNAFAHAGVLPADTCAGAGPAKACIGEADATETTDRTNAIDAIDATGTMEANAVPLAAAAAFIGRTPCELALLPLEDVLGLVEQPNIPGTVDEHPNWRRRLPAPLEVLLERPSVRHRLAALQAARQASPP